MITKTARIIGAIYHLQGEIGCTVDELEAYLGSEEEVEETAQALNRIGAIIPPLVSEELSQPIPRDVIEEAINKGIGLNLICRIEVVNLVWIEEIHDAELMAMVKMFDGLVSEDFNGDIDFL